MAHGALDVHRGLLMNGMDDLNDAVMSLQLRAANETMNNVITPKSMKDYEREIRHYCNFLLKQTDPIALNQPIADLVETVDDIVRPTTQLNIQYIWVCFKLWCKMVAKY